MTTTSFEYFLKGSAPQFYEFSDFTTSNVSSCPVTSIEIYADKLKTPHSNLEIVQLNGKNIVKVKKTDNFIVETTYKFYMLAKISNVAENWVSISGVEEFELKTTPHCKNYISFR